MRPNIWQFILIFIESLQCHCCQNIPSTSIWWSPLIMSSRILKFYVLSNKYFAFVLYLYITSDNSNFIYLLTGFKTSLNDLWNITGVGSSINFDNNKVYTSKIAGQRVFFIVAQQSSRCPYYLIIVLIELPTPVLLIKLLIELPTPVEI